MEMEPYYRARPEAEGESTPDMEFAVVGLLVRVQIDARRAQDALESLMDLRERFV